MRPGARTDPALACNAAPRLSVREGDVLAGFTHQRLEVERYARSINRKASPTPREAPVWKLRRVVVGRASAIRAV